MPVEKSITLGAELELVKLSPESTRLMAEHRFVQHYDRTIRGRNGEELPRTIEAGGGCELVTGVLTVPVRMTDNGDGYTADFGATHVVLRDLCACAEEVNGSCGLHLHLGRPAESGSVWKPSHVRTMLVIARFLEETLYDLCPSSRRDNQYCKPIAQDYSARDFASFYPVGVVRPRKYDNPKRYCWLNLIETRRQGTERSGAAGPALGTIEIRMLGNVRRHRYVQAWAELWVKLAAYVAYLEPSLAISHCCYGGSLEAELSKVRDVKNDKSVVVPAAPVPRTRRKARATPSSAAPSSATVSQTPPAQDVVRLAAQDLLATVDVEEDV